MDDTSREIAQGDLKIPVVFAISLAISACAFVIITIFLFPKGLNWLGLIGAIVFYGIGLFLSLYSNGQIKKKVDKAVLALENLKTISGSEGEGATPEENTATNGKTDDKCDDTTLGIPAGIVRGFLILVVSISVIGYLFTGSNPPVHLLMIFAVILGFYGLSPKDVLPSKLVVEVPDDFGKLSRVPGLNKLFKQIQDQIASMRKELVNWKNTVAKITDKDDKQISAARTRLNDKLDVLSQLAKRYSLKTSCWFEQFAILVLLVVLIVLAALYMNNNSGQVSIDLVVGPAMGIFSIISGVDVSVFISKKVKAKADGYFGQITTAIDSINNFINWGLDTADNVLAQVDTCVESLNNKNFFDFFPSHLVGCIAIAMSACVGGLLLAFPTSGLMDFFLIILEEITGFYFITKK